MPFSQIKKSANFWRRGGGCTQEEAKARRQKAALT
jgi:hypothetical protein